MSDDDPMLGEESETYMQKMMARVRDEMAKDRAALRPQGVSDVGAPLLLGGKGMQNGLASSIT